MKVITCCAFLLAFLPACHYGSRPEPAWMISGEDYLMHYDRFQMCFVSKFGPTVYTDYDCPEQEVVEANIQFVLDYAKAPRESTLTGTKIIFTPSQIDCGAIAVGCSHPWAGVSIVDTRWDWEATLRHEVYHLVLYRDGKNPADVEQDIWGHRRRTDWREIERGPR